MRALLKRRLENASGEELNVICDAIASHGTDLMKHIILRTGSRWSQQSPSPWQGAGSSCLPLSCLGLTFSFFAQRELVCSEVDRVCKYWHYALVHSPEVWRSWTILRPRQLLAPASLALVQRMDMNGNDPFELLPDIGHVREIVGARFTNVCDKYVDDRTVVERRIKKMQQQGLLAWRSLTITVFNDSLNSVTSLPFMPMLEHLSIELCHFCPARLLLRLDGSRLKSFRLYNHFKIMNPGRSGLSMTWESKQVDDKEVETKVGEAAAADTVPLVPLLTHLCFNPIALLLRTTSDSSNGYSPLLELLHAASDTLTHLEIKPNDPTGTYDLLVSPEEQKKTESPMWRYVFAACKHLEHLEFHSLQEPKEIQEPWLFASTLHSLTLPVTRHATFQWLPIDTLTALEKLTLVGQHSSRGFSFSDSAQKVIATLKSRGVTVVHD